MHRHVVMCGPREGWGRCRDDEDYMAHGLTETDSILRTKGFELHEIIRRMFLRANYLKLGRGGV